MVSSRSRRTKVVPPSPEPELESDLDLIDSDEVDELEDNSEDDILDEDDDMVDASDISGLIEEDNDEDEDEDDNDDVEDVEDLEDEDEDEEGEEGEGEEEEEDMDSDLEILRKQPMTKRQRAKHNKEEPEEYLELPMATGKKRQLTEEEAALRKSEVARRRKNQSMQRAEKDKQDTINRLLKKQATKSKKNIKDDGTPDDQSAADRLQHQQDPHRIQYIQNQQGSTLNIPQKYSVDEIFGQESHVPSSDRITVCQVDGCQGARKYVGKRSGKVVCSFDHYKLVEV